MYFKKFQQETSKQGLQRIARYSLPFHRQVGDRKYLITIGLLILIVSMLAVAVVAGIGATNIFRTYAEFIEQLASPFGK